MEDTNKFNEETGKNRLSRRRMLHLIGMSAAGAALLAACGDPTATVAPVTTAPAAATTAAVVGASTTAAVAGAATTAASGQISGAEVKASGKVVMATAKDLSGTVKKLVEAFNAKNSGVTIDYQELSTNTTEVHDKLATAFAAKDSSLDLVSVDIAWAPEFGSAGFLLPLDKYLSPTFRSNFFESTLLGTTVKEKVYGVPWYLNGGVLYYRKDLLEKGGVTPPNTFDELAAAATKLQTDSTYGYVVNGFKNEGLSAIWLEVLWGYGGEFMNTTTNEVLVNSPEGEAAVQFLVDGIYNKKFIPDKMLTWKTPDAYNVFTQGNAVFLRGWTEYAAQAEGAESKIKGMWGVKPFLAVQGKKPAACLGPWNLGVNASSKNPDGAWKVIEFLSSAEAQKIQSLGRVVPPARKDIYNDKDVLVNSPSFNILTDVFQTAKARPVTPAYTQISNEAIQEYLSQALSKKISAKDAVKGMADTTKQILAKFKG